MAKFRRDSDSQMETSTGPSKLSRSAKDLDCSSPSNPPQTDDPQFGSLLPFVGFTFVRQTALDGDVLEGTPFIEEKVRSHYKVWAATRVIAHVSCLASLPTHISILRPWLFPRFGPAC